MKYPPPPRYRNRKIYRKRKIYYYIEHYDLGIFESGLRNWRHVENRIQRLVNRFNVPVEAFEICQSTPQSRKQGLINVFYLEA